MSDTTSNNNSAQRSNLSNLPAEILGQVAGYLSTDDTASLRVANRRLKDVTDRISQQYITVGLDDFHSVHSALTLSVLKDSDDLHSIHSTLPLSRIKKEYPIQELTINTMNLAIPDDDEEFDVRRLRARYMRDILEAAEQTLLERLDGVKVQTCRILYQGHDEADPAHFPTSDLVSQIPSEITLQVMSTGEDDRLSHFLVTLPESGQTISYAGGLGHNKELVVDMEGVVSAGVSSFTNSRASRILARYLKDKVETETRYECRKREARENAERLARDLEGFANQFEQEDLRQANTAPTVEELLLSDDFRPRQFRTLQGPLPGETLLPLRATDHAAVTTVNRSGLAWLGRPGEEGSLVRINPEGTLTQLQWRDDDGELVRNVRLGEEDEERLLTQSFDLDGFGDMFLAEERELMAAIRASSSVWPYVSSEAELSDQGWDRRSQVSLHGWAMSSVANPADFDDELSRWID